MEGFNYVGLVINQITGSGDYTYLIEINEIYGFLSITLNKEEEQALIGARIAFNIDKEKNEIIKYKILEYIQMNQEVQTKDLSTIPEEFYCIFTTDWNKGSSSEMCNADRQIIHQIFLEYNKWSVNQLLLKNMPSTDEVKIPLVGFIKD